MKTLKETLFENRFFKTEQDSYTVYANVISVCSELGLSVSETYFFKKDSDELEHKSFTVRFMADLREKEIFPKNHANLPEITFFINKEFGRYGEIDTSELGEDGSFSIERKEPLLSLNEEFLESVEKYQVLLLKEFELRIKQ